MAFSEGRTLDRRLALYAYLRPLVEGARILELGAGTGEGANKLVALGAATVVSADARLPARADGPAVTRLEDLSAARLGEHGPFDLIVVPQAESLFTSNGAAAGLPSLAALQGLLAPGGHVVFQVESAEASRTGGGVDYYALVDGLSPIFPVVRTFGQTAFVAIGIAEFDAQIADLHVESELIPPESEEPSHFIAIAGADEGPPLGYALVQIPVADAMTLSGGLPAKAAPEPAPRKPVAPAVTAGPASDEIRRLLLDKDNQLAELTRQLTDAEGRADGVARVSRAQAEEIDELRARLRRAAETRAELDEEIARMRRALREADESVMNLTRKTADEMSALAAQLTVGLRPASAERRAGEPSVASDELKQRDLLLAQRESALFERDERIAALEIDKQDLLWQLDSARAELERLRTPADRRTVSTPAPGASLDARRERELVEALASRERALGEFRNAAAMHMHDAERLRSAVIEQAAHVEEIEEGLRVFEHRALAAEQEVARLRDTLARAEDADRARRSRLAEVEGTLLRLKHQRRAEAGGDVDARLRAELDQARQELATLRSQANAAVATAEDCTASARQESAELQARLAMVESALRESERERTAVDRKWQDAVDRMTGLEQSAAEAHESLRRAEAELHARPQGVGGESGAELASERPRLDDLDPRVLDELVRQATAADIERLREALDRSDEHLREARGQLVPLRGRIAELEREKDRRAEAERMFFSNLVSEIGVLEAGIQKEIGLIDEIMRRMEQQQRPHEGVTPTS